MQAQAMCLEIDLSRSLVFEHRPNSRPERSTSFKIREHQLKQHNTTRWDPPTFPNYSTNKKQDAVIRYLAARSKHKPQDLSNAGFFYKGRNDHTTCFHCGVSLKDWEASDSAWEEHSKWSPNCIYVAHNKGIEFVLHNAQVLKPAQGF